MAFNFKLMFGELVFIGCNFQQLVQLSHENFVLAK